MSSSPTVPKEDEADIPKEMAGGDEKAGQFFNSLTPSSRLGARPTNRILIKFKIRSKFGVLWFKMCWSALVKQAGKLALANASENLAGRVENRPGRVEFCIGYIRDYPVRASAKKF